MKAKAPNWREQAACADAGDLFFGPAGEMAPQRHERVTKARRICLRCPVRLQCLQLARDVGAAWGVWGGEDFEYRQAGLCGNSVHQMTPENIYLTPDGRRNCLACRQANTQRRLARERRDRRAA
jgi:WhiB family transcriptional regulator, redox-sensing transcriptional regulator